MSVYSEELAFVILQFPLLSPDGTKEKHNAVPSNLMRSYRKCCLDDKMA